MLLIRYFDAPVENTRWLAMQRIIFCMIALDCILLRLSHVGRYGLDGFNVAHWSAITFVPSPWFAGGLLVATSIACCTAAFTLPRHPWLYWIAVFLHTASWFISLLDSYQHHVFLSLVLLCFAVGADPRVRPHHEQGRTRGSAPTRAQGYNLLLFTTGTLYFWTAISKMNATWLSGAPLQILAPSWMGHFSIIAPIVVGIELLVAVIYWLIPLYKMPWGFVPVVFLHIGIEMMGLRIGWFSIYMIVIALMVWFPQWPHMPSLKLRWAFPISLIFLIAVFLMSSVQHDYDRYIAGEQRRRDDLK